MVRDVEQFHRGPTVNCGGRGIDKQAIRAIRAFAHEDGGVSFPQAFSR